MDFPLAKEYRAERLAFAGTLAALSPTDFDHGPTLCEGWAPRDVLAHLLGIDQSILTYAKHPLNFAKANAELVGQYAKLTRAELLDRAGEWSQKPAGHAMAAAPMLLGDLSIHHQDILRGLGRTRVLPSAVSAAILREGLLLGGALKLRKFRIVPTDGGRALGFGTRVAGTREVLGLWLSGRRGLDSELTFE